MNRTWFFYDKRTGIFTGATYTGPDVYLQQQLNWQPHVQAWEGSIDRNAVRVDLESMTLVPREQEAE